MPVVPDLTANRPDTAGGALSMLLPIWFLALANLWFGLATDLTLGVAARIAETFAGGLGPAVWFCPGGEVGGQTGP